MGDSFMRSLKTLLVLSFFWLSVGCGKKVDNTAVPPPPESIPPRPGGPPTLSGSDSQPGSKKPSGSDKVAPKQADTGGVYQP
jgi:hypothetical protein